MRRALVIATGLALVTLASAIAANRVAGTDPVEDVVSPTGTSDPAFDIRGTAAVHTKNNFIRHVVTVLDRDGSTRDFTYIKVRAGGRDYTVNAHENRVRKESSFRRAGNAKSKVKGNDVIVKYRPKAVGNPKKIKFYAMVSDEAGTFDLAPDYGRAKLRLRTERSQRKHRKRFTGYLWNLDERVRCAGQGNYHGLVLKDRRRERTSYKLRIRHEDGTKRTWKKRTNRKGRGEVNASLWINDRAGVGEYKAAWRRKGRQIASWSFRVIPEFGPERCP